MAEADLTELTIAEFLDRLASGDPTPGGGAAAALAGALGGSLVCMACNLTIGRDRFADVETEVRDILGSAERARDRLRGGASADAAAYGAVATARRLPRGDDAEATRRAAAIQTATRDAARVPLEVAEACAEVLALCERAVEVTNPHTISDVAVAALLAGAGLRSALANVEINLKSIDDALVVDDLRRRVTAVTSDPGRAARIDRRARERI